MCYLEVYCFVIKYLGIFQLFFGSDFKFNSISSSVLLNLLTCVIWPRMCSLLVNFRISPCALQNNVFSPVVG